MYVKKQNTGKHISEIPHFRLGLRCFKEYLVFTMTKDVFPFLSGDTLALSHIRMKEESDALNIMNLTLPLALFRGEVTIAWLVSLRSCQALDRPKVWTVHKQNV